MNRRIAKISIVTALVACFSAGAFAQQSPEETAIKYRQGVMRVMGWNFGPMGAMVKGDKPFDKAIFARNVARIEAVSTMPMEGFIPDSDLGETKAKIDIWNKPDKFKGAMEKMQKEVAKLAQASKAGDEAAMKTQFGEVGKACKGCHDDFRKK